jgi:hypothetical protein
MNYINFSWFSWIRNPVFIARYPLTGPTADSSLIFADSTLFTADEV